MKTRAFVMAFFRHALLVPIAIFALLPFAVMISTSLKPAAEIFSDSIRWWPQKLALVENYSAALSKAPLALYLANGVIVTAAIFLLQALAALPAAYALAKLRFTGRRLAFGIVVFCLLIPYQAIAIPQFILLHMVGLLDSYSALVLPFTISVFGIFLMRQFFISVPDDLVDAARMDGLSEFSIVWRVMLPSAIPALTAFGVFSVVAHWNDYFWPLVAVSSDRYFTPPLGVVAFRNDEAGNDFGPLMAAATIIVAPLIALFLVAQRRFIEGIAFTGIK
ncbi:carbohydrate ABC transporter permease [Agrobacterium genomosp. 3]|uniref:carbohydrate ABC transporter permease n=1 Tax=Rhizobium/Agrobacterium group TaxID=227290 RepID=UPI001B6F56CD|nr:MULTISPECIES: carbohydrate ABC transporter permease [Rhizobium/Agrobacterium group]MCA1868812.1 carbohydrate ABC transporter permease [Agrobacterium tomkonis]MCA1879225.1 carbohydrate ABC transporter permease [Agrobacterium tumefaciens]MBP8938255.1 carbohydrate ABC transporter permease [Agrobacterium sp.]MCA1894376.1 carbohydrate ABC transporter permease [Agrobacterium tomkonis]MCZ7453062.1 carbohydrate ABC transporter permease [Rhizobium rhizogenes]